jgi:hypothetical protein
MTEGAGGPPRDQLPAAGTSAPLDRVGDEQRSGSIAGIAVVLGFSLSFTAAFSQEGEAPWSWRTLLVIAVATGGIVAQLRAFMRVFALPNISLAEHAHATALFRRGVIAVLVAMACTRWRRCCATSAWWPGLASR